MKHIYSSITKLIVSILVLQLVITTAHAQWSTDPNVNNVICTIPGSQSNPAMTSDGSGGAIITWVDSRSGVGAQFADIYAQRISADGVVQWTATGVWICTAAGYQYGIQIIGDGSGGAIITWGDGIYVQRINSNGIVQWTPNGVWLSSLGAHPSIVSDGSGGAIITWDSGGNTSVIEDIYAQRVNSQGVVQWTANGVAICTAARYSNYPQIIGNGSGGAIISWQDARSDITNGTDIYAQKIDQSGLVQWTANGIAICAATGNQTDTKITGDNSGGAIITWVDNRAGSSNSNIYAQRINQSGIVQWTADGVAINTDPGNQTMPRIIADGSGGAFIACVGWGQRINSNGITQWGTGVGFSSGVYPQLINDGSGGAIVTYEDHSVGSKIYAQKVDLNGVGQWSTFQIAVSITSGGQYRPQLVSDGYGGAVITWYDGRNFSTTGYDIYAQQVNTDGNLGNITTGVEEQQEMIPNLNLAQNYPNPFKQSTKIKYEISNAQLVSLKVYDLFGKEIKTLVNEEKPAGKYEVDFDGSKIASGTYIIELQAGLLKETKKMILLK
jgi:hypothetical protein